MKYECKMIEDLLPLYKDGVCSEASSNAVKEHLAECPACTKMLDELKDTSVDELIRKEKDDVIGSQSKYFKRKSALIGAIIAGVFTLPILICLLVDIVSGHGLSWFYIVLAAMLIPTSLVVVPLMAPKNRMLYSMCSFAASVIVLLAVCCIYTGGSWFFVAAASALFGLTVCFMPFIACRRPVNALLGNKKGLTIMGSYTLTYFLMILCIGLTVRAPHFFALAFTISIPIIAMAWITFLIIRYLPVNGLLKAGICTIALSLFSHYGARAIVYACMLITGTVEEIQGYSGYTMIAGLVIGGILLIFGLAKEGRKTIVE
ncbi:MAG: zf-HC2 domain-containing protein [Lachnospiraceae bacterium]|nr:zf-HC2 domain-containing protein [Lachnospiraceae bacterium]